jgi:hypothetical protein
MLCVHDFDSLWSGENRRRILAATQALSSYEFFTIPAFG